MKVVSLIKKNERECIEIAWTYFMERRDEFSNISNGKVCLSNERKLKTRKLL